MNEDQPTLFNYSERKQLDALQKMVERLSKDYALMRNDFNNLKTDIENERKAEAQRRREGY